MDSMQREHIEAEVSDRQPIQRKAAASAPTLPRPVQRRGSPLGDFGIALGASPVQLAALDRAFGDLQLAVAGAQARQDAAVHQHAASGLQGAGGALPHLDRIQGAFGRHNVSHVQAKVGGLAADACAAIGAEAYASGDKVAFAASPSLHTAAHEAAHVVQQRAGVSLAGGVGRAGDPYEVHADRVADAVVQGKSAEGLLDQFVGGGGGAASVQRKDGKMGAKKVHNEDGSTTETAHFTIPLFPGITRNFPVPGACAALPFIGGVGIFVSLALGKGDIVLAASATKNAQEEGADPQLGADVVSGAATFRIRGEVSLDAGFFVNTPAGKGHIKAFARTRMDAAAHIAAMKYDKAKKIASIGALTGGLSVSFGVGVSLKDPTGVIPPLEDVLAERQYKNLILWRLAEVVNGKPSAPEFSVNDDVVSRLVNDVYEFALEKLRFLEDVPVLGDAGKFAGEAAGAALMEHSPEDGNRAQAELGSAKTFATFYAPIMAELEAVQEFLPEGAFNNCRSFFKSWWQVRDSQGEEAAAPMKEQAESYKAHILSEAAAAQSTAQGAPGGGVEEDVDSNSADADADADSDADSDVGTEV